MAIGLILNKTNIHSANPANRSGGQNVEITFPVSLPEEKMPYSINFFSISRKACVQPYARCGDFANVTGGILPQVLQTILYSSNLRKTKATK